LPDFNKDKPHDDDDDDDKSVSK